jgi:hypothetical protein
VKAFGEANQLDYRVTNEWELLKMNVDLYAKVATLPPVAGAKGSRPEGPKTDITRCAPRALLRAACAFWRRRDAECCERKRGRSHPFRACAQRAMPADAGSGSLVSKAKDVIKTGA